MYLVSYDIASDHLRNKVAKVLEGYGQRVQYSVFECDLTEKRYKELYQKLFVLAQNVKDGNIRFYSICKTCQGKKQMIGVPKSPGHYAQDAVIVI